MKALTLWRPWPWAILHAGKRIENRSWAPPRWLPGHVIALHAAKRWDDDGAMVIMLRRMGQRSTPMPDDDDERGEHPTGIVGLARVTGHVTESDDPWFCGPYGWTLDDVRELPQTIPYNGAQGLWTVPSAIVGAIEAQLGGPVT